MILSTLSKTWVVDIDGVIFIHNGYKELKANEHEKPLNGVKEFFEKIPKEDFIVLLTSRKEQYRNITEKSLKENEIRYDVLLMGIPMGERILINDKKPSGLKTAYAVNLKRNEGLKSLNIRIESEK